MPPNSRTKRHQRQSHGDIRRPRTTLSFFLRCRVSQWLPEEPSLYCCESYLFRGRGLCRLFDQVDQIWRAEFAQCLEGVRSYLNDRVRIIFEQPAMPFSSTASHATSQPRSPYSGTPVATISGLQFLSFFSVAAVVIGKREGGFERRGR